MPLERHFVVDEKGRGLRATWRPDRGFVNVSIWSDQSCVETFHLTPSDAGQLIGFLAGVLTAAVAPPARHLRVASDSETATFRSSEPIARLRHGIAGHLDRAAKRLRD